MHLRAPQDPEEAPAARDPRSAGERSAVSGGVACGAGQAGGGAGLSGSPGRARRAGQEALEHELGRPAPARAATRWRDPLRATPQDGDDAAGRLPQHAPGVRHGAGSERRQRPGEARRLIDPGPDHAVRREGRRALPAAAVPMLLPPSEFCPAAGAKLEEELFCVGPHPLGTSGFPGAEGQT